MRIGSLAVLLLTGCVSADGVRVQWVPLARADLQVACSARPTKPVQGCAKPGPVTCQIYTLDFPVNRREELHETLGHELRHCFEGAWH